ncbi:hypothetical protein ACFWWM_10675 [Streptomyces sp. NPDC058682]|uniref:NACHT N-terminal Helical domain 1-containing protein n=1 Tax=Streptomyces sp. NPDC058682 TaxID=3346596 RepID=UPI00365AF1DF
MSARRCRSTSAWRHWTRPGDAFAADLDPSALAAARPGPPAGLSPAAEVLYGRLVRLCCAHAVEYVTTLPGFGARADVEPVRRTGELARAVDRLGATGAGTAYAFEERYAQEQVFTHLLIRSGVLLEPVPGSGKGVTTSPRWPAWTTV